VVLDAVIEFKFDTINTAISKGLEAVRKDYFLKARESEWMDSIRSLVFDTYCRIHRQISIADMCARLCLGSEEGEQWIAHMVQRSKLDAKIDSGLLIVRPRAQSPHQQVIDHTKSQNIRTQMIALQICSTKPPAQQASQ
jgi:translation initiation factor 3 subunit E